MKKQVFIIFLFFTSFYGTSYGQETYNTCSNAFELCPNTNYTLNNISANATVCANCEDDFNFCFTGENTVWMKFTTNGFGGDVSINFSALLFQNGAGQGNELQAAIIKATVPCISSSYSLVSNCVSNATTNFTLQANDLEENTTYYVIVNGAMGASANAEATFDVELMGDGVQRNPQFGIWTNNPTICTGENAVFFATTEECDQQSKFDWYVNGEYFTSTFDPLWVYANANDGDIINAKVSCYEQCRDTLTSNSFTITVIDFPVDAGPDKTIRKGESLQLDGFSTENDILWSPAYNINNPNILDPIVHPEYTTTYYLSVSNGICTITDEMTVFVDDKLEIPNTFSPNGDGANDTWEILGIDEFPNVHVQVYTRWGQLVFETTGYPKEKHWDGTSKSGRELSAGAYYYVINLRDSNYEKPLKGMVSIVK